MLGLCFVLYEALDLFQSCYGNKTTTATTDTTSVSGASGDSAKRNLILPTVPEAVDGEEDEADGSLSSSSFVDIHLGPAATDDDTQQLLTRAVGRPSAGVTPPVNVYSISATIERDLRK